jgi:hypothetical protein
MLVRIYWFTWLAIGITAGLLYVTGNLGAMMLVVYGFVAFGMVFMGMMGVLPATISHSPRPLEQIEPTGSVETAPLTPRQHDAHSVPV